MDPLGHRPRHQETPLRGAEESFLSTELLAAAFIWPGRGPAVACSTSGYINPAVPLPVLRCP